VRQLVAILSLRISVEEKSKLNVSFRNIARDTIRITTTTDDAIKKEEKVDREKRNLKIQRLLSALVRIIFI